MRLKLWFALGGAELFRVGVTASLFFLLVGANNLIKILRDAIFLGHHSITELPYLYIMIAVTAGGLIAVYTRYTRNVSTIRLMLASYALIALSLVLFWVVLTYVDPGWSHYAFYIWGGMAGVIAVAQAWTLVSELFTHKEGERFFGLIAAGGTVGGAAAAFGTNLAVQGTFEANNLLWVAAGCFLAASVLVCWSERRLLREGDRKSLQVKPTRNEGVESVGFLLGQSRYLQVIALLILVSVVVSTLIDFEFKAAAKQAHQSKEALTMFFGTYYGWLSLITFFAQSILTARVFATFGFFPSLYLTPVLLLSGTVSMLIWPGLIVTSLTRMADAVLRQSVHRSGVEILYVNITTESRRTIKTFLDVVVERMGDATAGFIILGVSFWSTETAITHVHFLCVGLILVWTVLIPALRNQTSGASPIRALQAIRKSGIIEAGGSQIWQNQGAKRQLERE